ncbi:MAG: preprotein translocase subunit SecE [Proteobacteria bacterium]|nr:preprotein translocase subunit SecE [Pseudomonadota bacterium]
MKIVQFLKEVKFEAKKVSWTDFAQTRVLTVIVAIISTFIALYLLLIDSLLQRLIDFIVKF